MRDRFLTQRRHGLSAWTKRITVKMDMSDKKGLGIVGGADDMIKGLQKKK